MVQGLFLTVFLLLATACSLMTEPFLELLVLPPKQLKENCFLSIGFAINDAIKREFNF